MTHRLYSYTVKRTMRLLGSVLGILAVVGACSYGIVRAFIIRDVIVDAPGMIIELDKARFGKNLLFLPTDTLRTDLLAAYPLLSDVRFEKRLPGTLVVHMERRGIFAVLRSKDSYYALDENGLVLDVIRDAASFPLLEFDTNVLSVGSTCSDQRVRAALSFLRVFGMSGPVRYVGMKDSQSLQARMGNTNIFLPQAGDLSGKADTLQVIVEGFRIKGALPTVIDLRFDKPIVTH